MGKRYWAVWAKQTFVILAIVFALGYLTNRLSNPDSEAWIGGAIFVGLYFVATLALSFLHFVSHGLYLWLLSGDDQVDGILDDLRRAKLPCPQRHHPKTYDYLIGLVDDETAKPIDRVRAALLVGSYNVVMTKGIFRSLAFRKAADAAVLRYSMEAPEK